MSFGRRRWEQAPVYLSYRRSDSATAAHHLHDMLERRFGKGVSFLDVRDIAPGAEFPAALRVALARCRVMLVLIGPGWLAASDPESHRRRIDDPADWVFQEIREGLSGGRLVVPVLTGDHPVPRAEHLPPAIAGLAQREARRLRHESWPRDFAALADGIAGALGAVRSTAAESGSAVPFLAAVARSTIAESVGTKYIPSLYVSRGGLEESLTRHVTGSALTGAAAALGRLGDRLQKLEVELLAAAASISVTDGDATVASALRDVRQIVADIGRAPLTRQDHRTRATRASGHASMLRMEASVAAARSSVREPAAKRRAGVFENLRRLADDLDQAAGAVDRAARPVVAVVERAGRGKTNLLCDLALRRSATQPVIVQVARSIGPGRRDLRAAVAATLKAVPGLGVTTLAALADRFGRRANVAVLIDGINENADPAAFARQLRALITDTDRDNVRFVLTCRQEYWPLFEPALRDLLAEVHLDALGKFGPQQYQTAVELYFRHFGITGEVVGEAREALHDPLLLRFFCEAYAHTRFGGTSAVTEIRRLPLFELYTARKIQQIADLHPRARATHAAGDHIEALARLTATRGQLSLDRRDVAKVLPRGATTTAGSVYRALLDEDLIIEENLVDLQVRVGFVYEAFMEYALSRTIRPLGDADPATAGIVWYLRHAHFHNRVGVLGFYLAHLFTADRSAGRRLLALLHEDGGSAPLTVLRLALENIDVTTLEPADVELVLALPLRAVGRREDQPVAGEVLTGLARAGPATLGLIVEGILRRAPVTDRVWMLEALGEHDDRLLLVSLWARFAMPSPLFGLGLRLVGRLEAVVRDGRSPHLNHPEARRVLAEIGQRWSDVGPALTGSADPADQRLVRFGRLMSRIAAGWRDEAGASPVTVDDVVRLVAAERPAEQVRAAPGSGRRYRRAPAATDRPARRSPDPDS